MHSHTDKIQGNKSEPAANSFSNIKKNNQPTFQFINNRPEAFAQRRLQAMVYDSAQVKQAAQLQVLANHYSAHNQQPIQKKKNNATGLPDHLKSGIESLSGYSMDDVKVHYNSHKPAQLHAHAYAQGADIHIARGQEKHLPHEAWHVVQQKQGRVKPTMQMKGKSNVNDDAGLEKEADRMGAKALEQNASQHVQEQANVSIKNPLSAVIQRYHNPAYQQWYKWISLVPKEERKLDNNSSMALAGQSIKSDSPLAFIVNTILPYSELVNIQNTINAMVGGLDAKNDFHRIAIVLGVNAPKGREAEMEKAIEAAAVILDKYPFPIAIVRLTFTGKFPHGTMRNQTMHSEETRAMTLAFTQKGLHPYLSFQDSDASSRRVGSDDGPHVFNAVNRTMLELNEEGKLAAFQRPLMVAGGYRPQNHKDLVEMTAKRLAQTPIKGVSKGNISGMLSGFEEGIAEDMKIRDMFAKMDPMLPYSPEPNLFIDATAAYHGGPGSSNELLFGPNASEYAQLSRGLANYNRMELEAYYGPLYDNAPEPGTSKSAPDKEDIKQMLIIDSQNNRHPVREKSFTSNYAGMAIGTDLSRLAYGKLKKKSLQSHDLTFIATNLFEKRGNKKGVSLAKIRDAYIQSYGQYKSPLPYMEQFVSSGKVAKKRRAKFFHDNKETLGGKHWQQSNRAMRGRFKTDSFKGLRYGLPKKRAFHHNVAIALHNRSLIKDGLIEKFKAEHETRMKATQAAHIENLRSNALPLQGTDLRLRLSHWTAADGECGIYALGFIAGNKNWNRNGLIQFLRQLPESAQRDNAIGRISGENFTRWLSDDDIMAIATVLEIRPKLAIVQIFGGQWITMQGDPTTAQFIIGGVPAAIGGANNHWVVLKKE